MPDAVPVALSRRLATTGVGFASAVFNGIAVALGVTMVCLLITLPIIAIQRFAPDKLREAVAKVLAIAGYAAPGAVLALAIFGTAAAIRGAAFVPSFFSSILVSGSFIWLGYGLVVRYFPIAGQMVKEGYAAIPKGLDDAGRLLGHPPRIILGVIHLPLLRTTFAAAGVIIFIDVIKELPLTLILRPFDFETLGTLTYGLADQGKIFACAAPSLAIITIGSLGLIVVELFIWKRP